MSYVRKVLIINTLKSTLTAYVDGIIIFTICIILSCSSIVVFDLGTKR